MKTIIEMLEPAFSGWDYDSLPAVQRAGYTADQMREYAELVRADEREACAKVCESHGPTLANGAMLAEAIRARGNT